MTSIQESPLLAASNKYKRRKQDTEYTVMGSNTDSKTAIVKEFDSTTQTDVYSISVRVRLETLNSDLTNYDLNNSVCVKVETDEWYSTAAGFYYGCAKSEQDLQEEMHQDSNKQDGLNCVHEQSDKTGYLEKGQDGFTSACVKSEQIELEVMHQDVTRYAGFNSGCVIRKQTLETNADQCPPISSNASFQHGNMKAGTSIVETISTHQLGHSDDSKEADDRHVLGRWYALPSEKDDVDELQVSVDIADRHVLLRSHSDQSGLMFDPGSVNQGCEVSFLEITSSVLTTPTLNSAGIISDKINCLESHYGAFLYPNIMDVKPVLPTSDTDTLHSKGQQRDNYIPTPRVVPCVVPPSVPSGDNMPANPDQDENIHLPSLSPQSSQTQYYQQQQPQLVTTVKTPQYGAKMEPVFDEIQEAADQILEEHNFRILNGLQLQVLPLSASPSIMSSSVAAVSFKSTDDRERRDCVDKSIKKDVPSKQFIELSSDLTDSMDQKVALLQMNCPHVTIPLIRCDSKSNLSQDVSERMSSELPLSTRFKMAEIVVTSEVLNSDLAAESGECSSDDWGEIFKEKNTKKRKNYHSTLPASKRVRGHGSSKRRVKPMGASVRERSSKTAYKELTKDAEAAAVQSCNVFVEKSDSEGDACVNKTDSDSGEEWTPHTKRRKLAKENAVKRNVPLFLKPAKRESDEKRDHVKKVERVTKANTPENDKSENNLSEKSTASFMNFRPPDNDHFLYCGKCNKEFEGDCPVHGPYNYIQDKEGPEGDPHRADHTVPDSLEIKTSNIVGAGLGVFSKLGLESRIMFGPYGGDVITDNHTSGYCWQIYTDGKASHFVDAQNKATSNWMRYVNCAMTEADQNLVAFQYKGGIYYCTFKPISLGEELLVWYGDEYAKELGLNRDKNLLFKPKYVNGEEMYQCVYCPTSFTTAVNCVRHLMRMHGRDKLTSNDLQVLDQWLLEKDDAYCKKYSKHLNHTTINTKLNSISNGKHNKSGIAYSVFDKQITSAILQKKNNENTEEKKHTIEVCNNTSNNSNTMKTNMIKHTGEGRYKCEVCDYACNTNGNLKQHMNIHTGEKRYKCEVCGNAFTQIGHLKRHMRIHTGEKMFTCEVCGYAGKESGELKRHMRKHTGEKMFKCELCDYSCNDSHLKRHMRIHTGERVYKCEVCGYACNQSCALKKHMRIHTGERPYKCAVCGSAFNESGSLKRHMTIHSGERVYKCEVCEYACSTNSNLKRHMKIHTG